MHIDILFWGSEHTTHIERVESVRLVAQFSLEVTCFGKAPVIHKNVREFRTFYLSDHINFTN